MQKDITAFSDHCGIRETTCWIN